MNQFDLFWEMYPRKQGKGAARKAWAKLSPQQQLAALEDDTRARYSHREYRLIPHPSTYLNQERWEDDLDPAARDTRSRSLLEDLTDTSWTLQ